MPIRKDRLRRDLELLKEDEALEMYIKWDENTHARLATGDGDGVETLSGELHISGLAYPFRVSFPSGWPCYAPDIEFPSVLPPLKSGFWIDDTRVLHVRQRDWSPALTLNRWLWMIIVDVLEG